jgi:hypothetical protein
MFSFSKVHNQKIHPTLLDLAFKIKNLPRNAPNVQFSAKNSARNFFNDKDADNEQDQDRLPQIPIASPVALTSSTRTDLTYPPIENLTRMQIFRNLATQPTLSPDNNNSMPSRTTSVLFVTYHHGHAKSLTFGPNK